MTRIFVRGPVWWCLGLLLFFSQCQKEAPVSPQSSILPSKDRPILVEGRLKSSQPIETQLGALRANPYAVDNMTAAWNTLYPQQTVARLPVTDLYIKFEPSNLAQLRALEEAIATFDFTANPETDNDPFLVDHPLDREVLAQGDCYHDPAYTSDDIPPYYGVVKPNFVVPVGLKATVLEELVLAPHASFLTMEAHRRLGLDYVGENGQVLELCGASCPNFPACLGTNVTCSGGGIQPLPMPCAPGAPHWPACLAQPPSLPGLPNTPPTQPTNSCGCPISSNPHIPGGCVQVFDTQLDWQKVKNVEIEVTHWFKCRKVYLAEGCWRLGTSFPAGFQARLTWCNQLTTMRLLRLDQTLRYGVILRQPLGLFRSGSYNDIQIQHHFDPNNGSVHKAYWMASTAMNALYEHNAYASQQGIGLTPSNLDILLTSATTTGAAAPMLGKLKNNGHAYLTTANIALGLGVNISMSFFLGLYVGPWAQLGANLITHRLVDYPPDVLLNYGGYDAVSTTDNIKSTMYHEYAHAAHYAGLPSNTRDAYWSANIDYIVNNELTGNNSPYGIQDGTVNSERCALMEMWGFYMGYYMADLTYGEECQESRNSTNPIQAEAFRFIYREVEEFDPNDLNNANAWIPEGLPLDLIDGTDHLFNPNISDPVNDQVQGFTNRQIFESITNDTPETMDAFVNNIKTYSSSPWVDTLITEYNY